METQPEPAKHRDLGKTVLTILVALIVLSAGMVVYVLYERSRVVEAAEATAIVSGDTVTMDYIGRLADGRVFDTSIVGVAWDNILYPKSLTFAKRDNDSYGPFVMTAGNYGPGGTIKGFALGVLGMYPGQVKTIYVSTDEGYAIDPSKLFTFDKHQAISATETMSESDFRAYFSIEPIPLRVLPHYLWTWNVRVISVVDGVVTFKHEPTVGQVVMPFGNPDSSTSPSGWYVSVESFDPLADGGLGRIVVDHLISSSDVLFVKGVNPEGDTFILWDFDDANQTFQIHMSDPMTGYNAEVSGRPLFFEVTIIAVTPAD